jgi:hypothetical protein
MSALVIVVLLAVKAPDGGMAVAVSDRLDATPQEEAC